MQEWIEQKTRAYKTSDQRLHNRLQKIIDALASHPESSIPDSCETWAATHAAYRFLSSPSVSG